MDMKAQNILCAFFVVFQLTALGDETAIIEAELSLAETLVFTIAVVGKTIMRISLMLG